MAEDTTQEAEVQNISTEPQETTESSTQEVKYTDEGAKNLDEFLSDVVGPDYADKTKTDSVKPKSEESEDERDEPNEIDEGTKGKIEELLSKSETDGLTDEEIVFMKEHGYEIEEEISDESTEDQKVSDQEEVKEETEPFSLPEDFVSEIDDFFSDDDEYDPGKVTPADRLSRATLAIRKMRENQSRLREILADSPELANIISDLDKGDNLENTIRKHLGDILHEEIPKAGTPEYDKWVIKKEDAKRERKRIEDLQKQKMGNLQKSADEAVMFVKENKWNKKQSDAFNEKLDKHFQDIAKGIVTKEFMTIVKNGLNYKEDIKNAERVGEVRAANRRIKMKKRTGDGIPKFRTNKTEIKKTPVYPNEDVERFDKFLSDIK